MWPGMQLQKLTTREPDLSQLAVAIAAHGGRARRRGPARRVRRGQGGHGGRRLGSLRAMIESLVEQIEARFQEAQAQMSDPEVIGDRQRYAEAGRLFNQLSTAAKLAEEWRHAKSDAEGAEEMLAESGDDPELRAEMEAARERMEELAEEIRLAMVERDPNDDKDVIVEIRAGAGGDEAGPVGGRPLPDAHPLRRAARLQDRDAGRARRLLHARDQGRRRLLGVQVRGRDAPRAARARDRVAGAHPHLDRDGRGAAGGRGRRHRAQPSRPRDRRLPLLGPGRAVGQHDRLRGADHPQADRASSSRCRTRSRSCRTARRR